MTFKVKIGITLETISLNCLQSEDTKKILNLYFTLMIDHECDEAQNCKKDYWNNEINNVVGHIAFETYFHLHILIIRVNLSVLYVCARAQISFSKSHWKSK